MESHMGEPTRQLTLNPGSSTRRGQTRWLTLNLGGDCSPVVSKPFTAIFPHPMLLLNLGFDSLTNVLKDYSLYPVCARDPRLPLTSKNVFRAQGHISILAGTRGCRVRGQAHLLLPRA